MPHRDPAGWPWLKERLSGFRQATRPAVVAVPEAAPAAVVRTAVVTDSAAALPADWVRALAVDGRLTVVPMPVMVGTDIYGEGEDDIADTIAVALASGKPVKTSRPSPGQFEQAYRAARRQGYRVRRVGPHIRGTVRNGGFGPPRRRPGGISRWRSWTRALSAWRRGWACRPPWPPRRTAGPRRTCGTSLSNGWPAPRSTSMCRASSSCGGADGSAPRPRSGGPCSPSNPSSRWKTAKSSRSRRCGRRRRPSPGSRRSWWPTPPPGPRGRPGSPSTTSATRPRPNSSRRSWPTPSPAALPCQISALPAVLAAHAGLGVLAVIVGEDSGHQSA